MEFVSACFFFFRGEKLGMILKVKDPKTLVVEMVRCTFVEFFFWYLKIPSQQGGGDWELHTPSLVVTKCIPVLQNSSSNL